MQAPGLALDEELRLHSLRALRLLDSAPEDRFDRLTRLACTVLGAPISLISLIDAERQWFKSVVGLNVAETPRNISFCAHCILGEGVLVVENALQDPRFADNPLVVGEPYIRAYAGSPLRLPNRAAIGTLCVIDIEPRSFAARDLRSLWDLARLAEQELMFLEMTALDELTMLLNRRGLKLYAQYVLGRARRSQEPAVVLMFDIDRFKEINDQHGHGVGDVALKEFSNILKRAFRETDAVARTGGDEFVVFAQASSDQVPEVLARVNRMLQDLLRSGALPFALDFSVGFAELDHAQHADFDACVREADRRMYAAKKARTAVH